MTPKQELTLERLKDGPCVADDIAEELGITKKAASMRLSRMEASGLVRNVGMQHLDRGRPARIFEVANA